MCELILSQKRNCSFTVVLFRSFALPCFSLETSIGVVKSAISPSVFKFLLKLKRLIFPNTGVLVFLGSYFLYMRIA